MIADAPYAPDRNLLSRVTRRVTQWRAVKPMPRNPDQPIVSFCFDDFPRSAADAGADLLEAADGRGTFYACSGFAGRRNHLGDLHTADDILALDAAGHEIGAHGDAHVDFARTPTETALEDIEAGVNAIKRLGLGSPVESLSYPYGQTTPALKALLADRFTTARGVLDGVNEAGGDLMQLRAVELTGADARFDHCATAIEKCSRTNSWLVVFTHDVRHAPSAWGVQPYRLRRLIRQVRDAGAALLPVRDAAAIVTGPAQ